MQKKYLEQMGHTVIMTRTDPNKDLALVSRGKASKGCDLFASNHSNAVGSYMDESRSNVAVYHLVQDHTTECDDVSKDFAEKIAPVIGEVMGLESRVHERAAQSDRNGDGFKNDNYYGVLHGSRLVKTPGVILEHGFHTHSATVRWLLDDNNLERLAKAEAEFIDSYFGGSRPGIVVPSSDVPYKVRVTIKDLNIRTGPGVNYAKTGKYVIPGVYTIIEESCGWGRLKSKIGWIRLKYATKI
jgi:N-acetylmuramoyl-L-alanine amidase